MPVVTTPEALLSFRCANNSIATRAPIDEDLSRMLTNDSLGGAAAENFHAVRKQRHDLRIVSQVLPLPNVLTDFTTAGFRLCISEDRPPSLLFRGREQP